MHPAALRPIDHPQEEASRCLVEATIGIVAERALDSLGLLTGEPDRERASCLGRMQETLPAILRADAALDEALVDQLLQDAVKTLFRDLQEIEKIGDRKPRAARDEMDDPVVRTPETKLAEHAIRVADEIAIGEEEKFDQLIGRLAADLIRGRKRPGYIEPVRWGRVRHGLSSIYVSLIDIFQGHR